MPPRRRRSPARLLAPLALIAFVLALFLVLSDSKSGDGEKARSAGSAAQKTATEKAPQPKRPRKRAAYTVKAGDSLGAISEKTGVDVEALQTLNPEVDAQALTPGQKLKLRE